MKVIIAGSRGVSPDPDSISEALIHAFGPDAVTEVVSGTARGADEAGEEWALLNHKPVRQFAAAWGRDGKRAGKIRNGLMGEYADALLAFWDGESPGTAHMIAFMVSIGKPVKVVRWC